MEAEERQARFEFWKRLLFSFSFLLLLGVSNSLWGTTVGIEVFIDDSSGVSPNTVKGGGQY